MPYPALWATAAALILAPAASPAQAGLRVVLVDTAVLAAPRLRESSGVAASRRLGVYWSHNDSGDRPLLYATDSTGADLGFVTIQGARNVDWEDIARGPCVRTEATCLYLADIGDNDSRRPYVTVYRLAEPQPPAGPRDTNRVVPLLDQIVLRYPDRPRNAEALAVTPDGWLLIIGKDFTGPARLFRTPIPRDPSAVVLEYVGDLDLVTSPLRGRLVTAADVSPDGRWLAVRTYVSIHLYRLSAGNLPQPLLPAAGLLIPVVETQGEGLAFVGSDGLVLTSERGPRNHAILTRLRILGLPR